VLTNCQKWLTTCQIWLMGVDKVTNTCQIYYLKWWFIDIQSILSIDIRKNQYNRTIINHITASEEFYLQRDHTDRQTNRRQRCFLYIIKKNILILPQTRLLIYTDEFNLHTLHRYKHTIQGRPPSPPVDNIHTHKPYAQTHKQASAFSTSAFFERGKPISEGGKLSTNQKAAFSYVLLLS
jgi:hypothetical protein